MTAKPKIALVYPRLQEVEFTECEVPYSIMFVGSALTALGYEVALFDERRTGLNRIVREIADGGFSCVGVSSMSGPQVFFAARLSREIRRAAPDAKIVWGGVHATVAPDSVLSETYIDFVVRGEGEETLPALIECLESGGDPAAVNGVSFRRDGAIVHNPDRGFIDFNSISLDWSLLNPADYVIMHGRERWFSFITSRGCPMGCLFCYNLNVNKRKWRSWSIEKTKQELEKILAAGVDGVFFIDDNFAVNRARILEITNYLADRGIHWRCDMPANLLTDDFAGGLRNCRTIFCGAESGSPRVLKSFHKPTTPDDILNAAMTMKKYGINGSFSWIIGSPVEEPEDLRLTLELVERVRRIKPDIIQQIKIYTPYPGSELYSLALEKGFRPPEKLLDWTNYTRQSCVLDYIDDPWLLKCISYVSYFYLDRGGLRKVRGVFQPALFVMRLVSDLRWKTRFFRLPVEFRFMEFAVALLSRAGAKGKK